MNIDFIEQNLKVLRRASLKCGRKYNESNFFFQNLVVDKRCGTRKSLPPQIGMSPVVVTLALKFFPFRLVLIIYQIFLFSCSYYDSDHSGMSR